VAVAALAIATAAALATFLPREEVGPDASAPREAARTVTAVMSEPARRAGAPSRPVIPAPSVAYSTERANAAPPVRRRPVQAVAQPSEPQWDGKGTPSREFMRWQLAGMVEQAGNGGISAGALDSAVEDALELFQANRDLLRLEGAPKDSEPVKAARERASRASENLARNLGIEGVEIPAYE
jgi:hypothetical protein